MSHQIIAKFAIGQIPNLDETIPSRRYNEGQRLCGRESDARHPFGMSFGITTNGEFAFSECVPQTDSAITGALIDVIRKVVVGEREREKAANRASE